MFSIREPRLSVQRECHQLLLAVEKAQKADILTYSSGHLNPYSLCQSTPFRKTGEPFWESSKSLVGRTNPDRGASLVPRGRSEAIVDGMKDAPFGFTMATGQVMAGTPMGRRGNSPVDSPHSGARERMSGRFLDPTGLLLTEPGSMALPGAAESRRWFTRCHLAGLTRKDQLRMMTEFERQILKTRDTAERHQIGGRRAAERHEGRLEEELRKLSVRSHTSRERLLVFSAVYDDVCRGSQLFGDILREIKREYELYLNSFLDPQLSPKILSGVAPLIETGAVSVEVLEEARQEVSRLTAEAREALEENDRVRRELSDQSQMSEEKGVQAEEQQSERRQDDCLGSLAIRLKRRKVWNLWEEVQDLEKEIREKMVSKAAASATEQCIRDSKKFRKKKKQALAEIIGLRDSNEHLQTSIQDMVSNISAVLNQKGIRDDINWELWEKIQNVLRHEDESRLSLTNEVLQNTVL